MVNSLVFTKMLVIFIFRLWGIRNFLAFRILVFYFSNYYNDIFSRYFDQMDSSNLSCHCTVWSWILYFTVLCYVHSIGACVHIVGLYPRVPPPVEMGASSQKQTWDTDILYQTCLVVTCFQYPICARSWLIEATWWVPLYEPWVRYIACL